MKLGQGLILLATLSLNSFVAQAESVGYNAEVSKCIAQLDKQLPLELISSSGKGTFKHTRLAGKDTQGKACEVTISISNSRRNDLNERQETLDVTIFPASSTASATRTKSPRFVLGTHEFVTKISSLKCSQNQSSIQVAYTGKALNGWERGSRVEQSMSLTLKNGKITSVSAKTKRPGIEKSNTCIIN
jgi:hypothetical protein